MEKSCIGNIGEARLLQRERQRKSAVMSCVLFPATISVLFLLGYVDYFKNNPYWYLLVILAVTALTVKITRIHMLIGPRERIGTVVSTTTLHKPSVGRFSGPVHSKEHYITTILAVDGNGKTIYRSYRNLIRNIPEKGDKAAFLRYIDQPLKLEK